MLSQIGCKKITDPSKGGFILVYIGTKIAEREGSTAIVKKYRELVRILKQTWVKQIILSVILAVMGSMGHVYRIWRRMAINKLVQQL